MIGFDQAAWLLLAPLALLPLLRPAGLALANTWAAQQPLDLASRALDIGLRAAAVLALAGVVFGLAGPHLPETPVQRQGQGAEIVLVLDRSRSMDQPFAGTRRDAPTGTSPEALNYYFRLRGEQARTSKGQVARELLSDFAASRPSDRFAMVAFSNLPLRVLGFTSHKEVVQAAIEAGNQGRGLSETNIARALQAALAMFDERPYTGSRVILLVSDGGDRLDVDARRNIAELARRHRVGINWVYLRAPNGARLQQAAELSLEQAEAQADSLPELFLDRFLGSLGVPYRAYEADDPQDLQRAIADIDRLEKLPISWTETLPRQDLSAWPFALALLAVLGLLAARHWEIRP